MRLAASLVLITSLIGCSTAKNYSGDYETEDVMTKEEGRRMPRPCTKGR